MIRARVHRTRRPLLPFFQEGRPTASTARPSTGAPRPMTGTSATAQGAAPVNGSYGTRPTTAVKPVSAPTPTALSAEDRGKLKGVFGSIYRTQGTKIKTTQAKEVRNEAFTPEQFSTAWYQFVQVIPNHPDIHFFFKSIPEIQEGNKITLVTSNSVAQEKLNELQPLLKKHLGDKLHNDTFVFDIQLKIDNSPTATPQEKAKMMTEKNKHLQEMLKEWNLKFS